MALDGANYIKDLNPNTPNGALVKVSSLDDYQRETKRVIVQSLPNIGGAVEYSHTELNDLRSNFSHEVGGTVFNAHGNAITEVIGIDDDTAVEPRLYNDTRYLQIENSLSELSGMPVDDLYDNLFTPALLSKLEEYFFNKQYPIGYVMTNATDSRNPIEYLGFGIWEAYATGRIILGNGSTKDTRNETRSFVAGNIGGEFQHVITESEMPSHTHNINNFALGNAPRPRKGDSVSYATPNIRFESDMYASADTTGGNAPHNNVQPYIVAYMWKRVS